MTVNRSAVARRSIVTAAGLLGDRLLGEPPAAVHPVAIFGQLMKGVEERVYSPDRMAGIAYALFGVGVGAAAGAVGQMPVAALTLAAAGRQLRETALQVHGALVMSGLDAARALLPALVGRDPSQLDECGVAAAVIESVAENTVDAVVAPACWALAGGSPGAIGYRAINTMDAMVGHRSARYEQFGWFSARLDDAANFVPARLTAILVAAVRPRAAGEIWRTVREDASAHPSPNSGVAEAAFAAVLGVELGGTLRYGERVEHRPLLGRGPRPRPVDIKRAVHLSNDVELALLAGLLGAAAGASVWPGQRQ
jgi:adenosylcobinamide-phosphate synthase